VSNDGVTRSAILLMSIGEEEAVEVLKHLGPREVQKLGQAMAGLTNVTREQVAQVLREFRLEAEQQAPVTGGDQYVRSVLTRALGSEKASALIDRILQGQDAGGIESLKWMDAESVAELVGSEHPQIIATILVHLDADQASEVLAQFDERLRNDVVLRIATLEAVQPAALRDLNEVLTQLLKGGDRARKGPRGGVEAAADILGRLGGTLEASVSAHLRETDAELAQQIQDRMFVFDNLVDLDDRALRRLLHEVPPESLIVALKGASEALRERIFQSMPQPAAQMLRDDLEAKGPVRLSDVEAQQREILRTVRRLSEDGRIVLVSRGGTSLVE
jgi:flagellar motor switch protein FliG